MNALGIRKLIEDIFNEKTKDSTLSEESTVQALKERNECFARWKVLHQQESENEAAQAELRAVVSRIIQEMSGAEERLKRAEYSLLRLQNEGLNISFAFQREEGILCATCSPLHAAFTTRINTEIERLMKLKPDTRLQFGDKNIWADHPKTPRFIYSQEPAIRQRMSALFSARQYVEQLKLQDRSDEELEREFNGIWANLPEIENQFELLGS